MSRLHSPEGIKTVEEAEATLADLALAADRVAKAEALAQKRIDTIKSELQATVAADEAIVELHTRRLEEWAETARAALWAGKKSKKFRGGSMGWRLSSALELRAKPEDVLQRLVDHKLFEAIKVTESLKKAVIKDYPASLQVELGVEFVTRDKFFVEPDKDTDRNPSPRIKAPPKGGPGGEG